MDVSYIGFMSMVALAAGILNTWKHFAVPRRLARVAQPLHDWRGLAGAPQLEARGIEPIYAMAGG